MEDNIAKSIEKYLKWLFCLLVPISLFCFILCIALLWTLIEDHSFSKKKAKDGKVVCARMELAVGDEITKLNIELRNLPIEQWPNNLVSPAHAFAIIGHKMVRPVAKSKPLDWYDTDVPVPTPSVSSEKLNYHKNPEPWNSPNGDMP